MSTDFIPFHVPSIGPEEMEEVSETLRSGWLTTGPRCAQFERELAAYVDTPHALAVSSATAGLHIALTACDLKPGDEVITTPLTFCSTVHVIIQSGAIPVLADVGADGNIDPAEIARHITPRTRAIIPVHLAGLPCDMRRIWKLAGGHGLTVIEDAAHAIGARYEDRPIGAGTGQTKESCSDAVVFSFYATKNLTTGEGGMITTAREDLARTARTLSLHGTSHDAWERYTERGNWFYQVVDGGFKYNLSDIQAAIGIHQLRKLERFLEIRARYARIYQRAFEDLKEVETPVENPQSRHAWHLYILRLNLERLNIDRSEFIEELKRKRIGTSVHFIPIPLHPYFERKLPAETRCPRAIELFRRIVSLPLYPAMSEEQVRRVAESVREIVARVRKSRPVVVGAEV